MSVLPSLLEEVSKDLWRTRHNIPFSNGIVVMAGFETDLASVPAWLHWLYPTSGHFQRASILHDWMYTTQKYPRKVADKAFMHEMYLDGVPAWRYLSMFAGVRLFGWYRWNRKK